MKFNTRIRYGIRTMLEIAMYYPDGTVIQKDISRNQEISYKYLDHIINSLRIAGLIVSKNRDGYSLTRKPSEITMYDILKAFEPNLYVNVCLSDNIECNREEFCAPKVFWEGLNKQVVDYFKSTTLESLMTEQLTLNKKFKINNI
jgi:Rrf2 family protein